MKMHIMRVMAAGLVLCGVGFGAGGAEQGPDTQGPAINTVSATTALPAAAEREVAAAAPAAPEPAGAVPASPTPGLPEPASVVAGTNLAVQAWAAGLAGTNMSKQVVAAAVVPEDLSPALRDLVRMTQAGVSEEVLLAYIENSTNIFNVGADEVVYLNDLGVPNAVITRLIEQDASPGSVARKQAMNAVKPLPSELALKQPATNLYPASASTPATSTVTPSLPEPQAAATPTTVYVGAPNGETPADVNYFYTALSPYGNWIQVPGYGLSWQPTVAVVNASWRPYSDNGCWFWTDHGWYWYSYYSWGWAPFHYGRWYRPAGYGWMWTPDTYWGPAWVTWRHTPFYCGWAPLPPHSHYIAGFGLYYNGGSVGLGFDFGFGYDYYTYIHWNFFSSPRPHHYFVPPHHARGIHRDTRPMTGYGHDHRPFNEGLGHDRVSRLARTQIRQLPVREIPMNTRSLGRQERLVGTGNSAFLGRPSLGAPNQRTGGQPPASRLTTMRAAGAESGPASRTLRAGTIRPAVSESARLASPRSTSSMNLSSPSAVSAASAGSTPATRSSARPSSALVSPPQGGERTRAVRSGDASVRAPASRQSPGPNVVRPSPRSGVSSPLSSGTGGGLATARVDVPPAASPGTSSRQALLNSTLARPATASPARPAPVFPAQGSSRSAMSRVPSAPPSVSHPTRTIPSAPPSVRSVTPSTARTRSPVISVPRYSAPSRLPAARSSTPAPAFRSTPRPSSAPSVRSVPSPSVRSTPSVRSVPSPSVRSAPSPSVRSGPSPSVRSAPAVRSHGSSPPSNRSSGGRR
ncbi:MAG: hypothetical protein JXQ71_13255 [Verrucomicrobia bacterium]|nr:hypothetical protein [Verrucomicrobiota bacterium]